MGHGHVVELPIGGDACGVCAHAQRLEGAEIGDVHLYGRRRLPALRAHLLARGVYLARAAPLADELEGHGGGCARPLHVGRVEREGVANAREALREEDAADRAVVVLARQPAVALARLLFLHLEIGEYQLVELPSVSEVRVLVPHLDAEELAHPLRLGEEEGARLAAVELFDPPIHAQRPGG